MNSVRKRVTWPKVFFNSLIASFAESATPRLSISFSIGGSGTQAKVRQANPSHHTPDEAMMNGMTQSPVIVLNKTRWTASRSPPPR